MKRTEAVAVIEAAYQFLLAVQADAQDAELEAKLEKIRAFLESEKARDDSQP